jgi:hypothetical protein
MPGVETRAEAPVVLVLLFFPDLNAGPATGVIAKLRRVERYKRNSRPPDYMRDLVRVMIQLRCELIEVPIGLDPKLVVTAERLEAVQEIVLLWPDAIGYGWRQIERTVFASKRPATRVSVLNGRRRRFPVTRRSLLTFRVRRAIERLWLGEIALAAGLLLTAPILVAWDAIRGRT